MRQTYKLVALFFIGISLLCDDLPLFAQTMDAGKPMPSVAVPFVGCKSDGQMGPRDAPKSTAPLLKIPPQAAQRLAYYQAGYGPGVLAPRGWYCLSTYGSNGSTLYVSPQNISSANFLIDSSGLKGFTGPAIQISAMDGDTSGRFEVAKVVARVFPDYRGFVRDVIAEGIEPASAFPTGPYPHDKLSYLSKTMVEFETPAQLQGMGTDSMLLANASPIHGVAIYSPDGESSLTQLFVRLPEPDRELAPIIIQQVERSPEKSP